MSAVTASMPCSTGRRPIGADPSMGRCQRNASPVWMRASSISRPRLSTCTSPDCRSSRHAKTARSRTTMCSGSSRPGSISHPDCDNVSFRCRATSADRCGWTMTGSMSTSTFAARPFRPPAVGSSWSDRSAASSPDHSIDRSPSGSCTSSKGSMRGRTAVLLKLHHALADGIGSMLIGSALFDLEADTPLGAPAGRPVAT